MKNLGLTLLVITIVTQSFAQVIGEVNVLDRDAIYIHYTPPNVIEDDFTYQRWSTKLSVPPIKLGKLLLVNTLGLDVHDFNYQTDTVFDHTSHVDQFYNINYSLFASYKLSEKWSANAFAAPFVLSNLQGSLTENDFSFNGFLFMERTFMRKKGGYFLFGLGAGYLTLNGYSQMTPIAHLKSRLNEKWSFVLGIPNTYVKYDFHERHSFKGLLDLNDFSANLNGVTPTNRAQNSSVAVFTIVSAGMEYNFWATPSLGIMFRLTQALYDSYEIRNDDDVIFDFNTQMKQPFVTVGIKFNPIRNLQNSLSPL